MRFLVPILLSWSLTLGAVEDVGRERLRAELRWALSELTEMKERLLEVLGAGGIAVPSGFSVTISARQTLVDDWMKIIDTPTAVFSVEEVNEVQESLQGVGDRIETLLELAQISEGLDKRWENFKKAPELQRYRDFLRSQIERGLREIAAGADVGGDDDVMWQRQRRHEIILEVIESTTQVAERWDRVPKGSPALHEFLEHQTRLRATVERGLQQTVPGYDPDLDRDQAIGWLLDEVVQLIQIRHERLDDRQIPETNLLLGVYIDALAAEEQAVRALITQRKGAITDEAAWQRQEEDLRFAREQRSRLSNLAWECLGMDLALTEQRQHLEELLPQETPDNRTQIRARLLEIEQGRQQSIEALIKGMAAGSQHGAITTKHQLRTWNHNVQGLVDILEQGREHRISEQEWRTRVAEPAVAAVLAKLDAAWLATSAAHRRKIETDLAAIKADLARELADVAAEEAEHAAKRSQQELEQAREHLQLRRQEVINAVENPAPKPEGDDNF